MQELVSSADLFFLKEHPVTYFLLRDNEDPVDTARPVVSLPIGHKPWPSSSMNRFRYFADHAKAFSGCSHLFYVDVDCRFVGAVDVVSELVGVRHCGFTQGGGPFERDRRSCLYADPVCFKHYYGGGFSGGARESYLRLSKWCADKIEEDTCRGIVPIYHDETALNRYFLDVPPTVSLDPGYHYPSADLERYRRLWAPQDYVPKILLLDKNHAELRG